MQRLRRETAADHEAVEGSLPLMDPALDTARYVSCLQQLHGLVAAWEEQSAHLAPAWLRESLNSRQRRAMLESDLASFGVSPQHEIKPSLPDMPDLPSLLGSMYVMEGSTLGGQLIARQVEATLGLAEGVGDAYFRSHGALTGSMWREFCVLFESHVPDSETGTAIRAARKMFSTFGAWMQTAPSASPQAFPEPYGS